MGGVVGLGGVVGWGGVVVGGCGGVGDVCCPDVSTVFRGVAGGWRERYVPGRGEAPRGGCDDLSVTMRDFRSHQYMAAALAIPPGGKVVAGPARPSF